MNSGPAVSPMNEVTRILSAVEQGDPHAAAQLLPLVYEELRKLAAQRMAKEAPGQTLQATALVHEAYLRLLGTREVPWSDRAQFFRAAADAMRRILIDHARAKGTIKRGGGRRRLPLDVLDLACEALFPEAVAIDDAVSRLQEFSPTVAEVVRLRFYAGLSEAETALALAVSERTIRREWTYARAWLFREMGEESS